MGLLITSVSIILPIVVILYFRNIYVKNKYTREAIEPVTRFLYEDDRWYWFCIFKYSDSYNKVKVYNIDPLSKNKLGIRYGDLGVLMGTGNTELYETVSLDYQENEVVREVKQILEKYITRIEQHKNKGRLKNFKGYVGDVKPEKIKQLEREQKLNDLKID